MTAIAPAGTLSRFRLRATRLLGAGLVLATAVLAGCMGGSYGAPKITKHPADIAVFETQTATFTFGAEGKAPLAIQWKRNGVAIPGATGISYTTPALAVADNGAKFSVTVSNGDGSVTSNEATLTVKGPPVITVQPAAVAVNVGATASFSVTATGDGLTYQWLRDDVVIGGATSATYTTAATVAGDDGAVLSVAVGNSAGFVLSTPVTLTVSATPAITRQPASQVVAEGDAAYFGVRATGGNLAYQWKQGGVTIPGATSSRLVLPAAALADDAATFTVTVTNALGTVDSSAATLSVAARAAAGLPAAVAQVDTSRATAAEGFTVVRKSDGTVWSWGYNGEGQRGDGTSGTSASDTPARVTLPTGAIAVEIAVGGRHALVRLQNGDVYAWGRNASGQLGQGTTTLSGTPLKVTLPRAAVAIAAGKDHSVAVLDDGSVCAWGLDDSGQLGVGGFTQSLSPVSVAAIAGVTRVAAGNAHTLALRTDGSVWAWGANAAGQLGDGTTVGHRRPVDTGLRNILAIGAGADVSFAFTAHRLVYGWGENSAGQLGLGAAYTTDLPTPTGLALDVVAASASDAHALLARTDGTVSGVGTNASGEVGDATTTARTQFTTATGVTTAVAVAAGGKAHSLALRADGQLYSWGDNAAKQLGNASLAAAGTSTPTLVPAFDATP